MTAATFADGVCRVAGLSLPAPLVSFGQIRLWAAVRNLVHDDLRQAAEALELPTHGLVDTETLKFMVGAELQTAWFLAHRNEVPPNVAKNHEARREAYLNLVKKLKEGKDMPKKRKKAEAAPRGHVYEVSAREPKDLGPQAEVVYWALKKVGPAQPAELAAALTKEQLKTKQDVARVVAYYLTQFKKSGYVKSGPAPRPAAAAA